MFQIPKTIGIFAYIFFFKGLVSGAIKNENEWGNFLLDAIQKSNLTKKETKKSFKEEEKNNYKCYLRETQRGDKLQNRSDAVLTIWFFGEDSDLLELIWWRSKDRSIRALIVAIYTAMRLEPISSIPPFKSYAEDFAEKEKKQRLAEIQWAEEFNNRKLLAKSISEWTTRNLKLKNEDEHALFKLDLYKNTAK